MSTLLTSLSSSLLSSTSSSLPPHSSSSSPPPTGPVVAAPLLNPLQCNECHQYFNVFHRKHTCKACQAAVCDSCSRHQLLLQAPSTSYPASSSSPSSSALSGAGRGGGEGRSVAVKERVCNACYGKSLLFATPVPPSSLPSISPPVSHLPSESSQSSASSSSLSATAATSADEARKAETPLNGLDPVPLSAATLEEGSENLSRSAPPPLNGSPEANTIVTVTNALSADAQTSFTSAFATSALFSPDHPSAESISTRAAATPSPLPSSSSSPSAGKGSSVHQLAIFPPSRTSPVSVAEAISPHISNKPVSPTHALVQVLKQHGVSGCTTASLVHSGSTDLSPEIEFKSQVIHSVIENDKSGPVQMVTIADDFHDPAAVRLDLPMKLCLAILNKTPQEMKSKYNMYLKTKEARRELKALSFAQFVFFSVIRGLPDFIFKKPELSYLMMREENEALVQKDAFVRYAPILSPLASRLDAPQIFELLAQDLPEGQGLTYATFKVYVDHLKREVQCAETSWPDFRESFSLPKSEQLITIRLGVTDTSHTLKPMIGKMGFCSEHLIYEARLPFKKRRCLSWKDITLIDKNDEGWMKNGSLRVHFWRDVTEENEKLATVPVIVSSLEEEGCEGDEHIMSAGEGLHHRTSHFARLHQNTHNRSLPSSSAQHSAHSRKSSHTYLEKPPIKTVHFDVPAINDLAQDRARFYLYLRMMHTSHILANDLLPTEPLAAAALLQETQDLLRRMRALEDVAPHVDPMKLNPYANFSDTDQQHFVTRVRQIVKESEKVKQSKQTWLSLLLPGLAPGNGKLTRGGECVDDIDPEYKETYKSFEEMRAEEKEPEPFSIKTLSYNVKLSTRQLQPVFALVAAIKSLRNWDRPYITAGVIAFLLNVCYRDNLSYLPALILLFHIVLTVAFGWFPEEFQTWLDSFSEGEVQGLNIEDNAHVIVSQCTDGQMNVASAVTMVEKTKPSTNTKEEEPVGLFARLKQYHNVAIKTKDHLTLVQNELAELNIKALKIEGLYKWRNPWATWQFLSLLIGLFVVMVLIPFRFIFPLILIDFFTDKYQAQGSVLDRLLAQVEPVMPKLD